MQKSSKRKKSAAKQNSIVRLVSLGVVLIIAVCIFVVVEIRGSKDNSSFINSGSPSTAQISNDHDKILVNEARATADKFFEHAKHCEVTEANSLRSLPKNLSETAVEDCKKECPTGLEYSFVTQLGNLKSQTVDGIDNDFVNFQYSFGCNSEERLGTIMMNRDSDTKRWLILNPIF